MLLGWRETTIDVDIRLEPEDDAILRALPRLKDELRLNVELASPADFIPLPSGWQERSPFLYRFPSIEPRVFRANLERATDRCHE